MQDQPGFVSLSSIVFKKGEPGFIDYVNDISENVYNHSDGISDVENHHARYEFDPFYSQIEGLNKQSRPIDGLLAPAVVYVSGSNPVMGATFYTRCGDALSITPTWHYEVDGMPYEMKFPTQRCTPQALVSPSSSDPQFIAYYNFKESEDSFPLGWTLAFEETSTISFEITEFQPISLPGGPPQPQWVPELSTTVKGTLDAYVVAKAHTPSTVLTSRGGTPLLYRYSSIRNGCFHGNNTNDYTKWLDNTFRNYFEPLNAKRGKNGIELEYWDRGSPACRSLSEMFRTGDGKCGFFSAYLAEIIVCQGYPFQHSQEVVHLASGPNYFTSSDDLVVDNSVRNRFGPGASHYTIFSDPVFAVIRASPFTNTSAYILNPVPGGISYPRNFDIVPIGGMSQTSLVVEGQNNTVPRHMFLNHVLHVVNNRILDPSYGYWDVHLPTASGWNGFTRHENSAVHIVRAKLINVVYTRGSTSRIVPCIVPIRINDSSSPDLTRF